MINDLMAVGEAGLLLLGLEKDNEGVKYYEYGWVHSTYSRLTLVCGFIIIFVSF